MGDELNPYRSPRHDDPHSHRHGSTARRDVTLVLIAISLITPIFLCYLVIDELVGVHNLTSDYWVFHGVMLSLTLNSLASLPFSFSAVRKRSAEYALLMGIVVATTAYLSYRFLTVAMLGV